MEQPMGCRETDGEEVGVTSWRPTWDLSPTWSQREELRPWQRS